jgi:hypothetical protein
MLQAPLHGEADYGTEIMETVKTGGLMDHIGSSRIKQCQKPLILFAAYNIGSDRSSLANFPKSRWLLLALEIG